MLVGEVGYDAAVIFATGDFMVYIYDDIVIVDVIADGTCFPINITVTSYDFSAFDSPTCGRTPTRAWLSYLQQYGDVYTKDIRAISHKARRSLLTIPRSKLNSNWLHQFHVSHNVKCRIQHRQYMRTCIKFNTGSFLVYH